MQRDTSEGGLAAALSLRRNALVGLATGGLFAAAIYAVFVGLQPATEYAAPLYLALAFVVAVSVGGLVAALLTAATAWRLTRE